MLPKATCKLGRATAIYENELWRLSQKEAPGSKKSRCNTIHGMQLRACSAVGPWPYLHWHNLQGGSQS